MSSPEHSFNQAIHAASSTARDLSNSAVNIVSMFFSADKKLKVQINNAPTAEALTSASQSALTKGASRSEVKQEVLQSSLAQKSKNPELFAQGISAAAVIGRAREVVPQNTRQRDKTQAMER